MSLFKGQFRWLTIPITKQITDAIRRTFTAAFNPASLFTGGYTGGWYDPSDLSTLWQDAARTTPVTADGQPVGAMNDKSGNGNHLTQATAGARPLYKTSGGKHWLEFDGIDDWLSSPSTVDFSSTDKLSFFVGTMRTAAGNGIYAQCGNITADAGSFEFGPFNTGVVLYRKGSGSFGAREIAMSSSVTHVLSATVDLAGTTHATENPDLRLDTTQPGFTNYGATDSGSGNFGNRTMYVGRKNGSGTEVNTGRIYQLAIVGKTASGTEIANMESFINGKVGAY